MRATADDMLQQQTLITSSIRGDEQAFQRLAEPYRREIQVHCYRMLGSLQDAEDVTQEAYLRAWRGLGGFEGRSSFRGWLYRIATNACLNALARQSTARRVLSPELGPSAEQLPGAPASEIIWLDPYPDTMFESIADTGLGPDARYELHETVQLAFVAAIQHLTPRQRAVLLLRDVLGWPASDTAELLDMTVASANSALQRARVMMARRFPSGEPASLPAPDAEQRVLLDRYVKAWETADLDGFISLLREDAYLAMPPWAEWYQGRSAMRMFFAWAWGEQAAQPSTPVPHRRLIATAANGRPAFGTYRRDGSHSSWVAHSLQVLTLRDGSIAGIDSFVKPELFPAFGLSLYHPDHPGEGNHQV
jgi:RNA polymerase sigma-70 factor, ECF subfamily